MSDLLASLNPEQRTAVLHGKGPALVLAGAGSGKTRVIAHRIAFLIQNGASRPENILAVTFTNKAAREMRERVHVFLGPNRASEPLIATFHSLCVRVLRREIHHLGYKQDFSIYDTDDQRRLMKQILEQWPELNEQLSPKEVLSRISFAKNHNAPPAVYTERFPSEIAEPMQQVYTNYERRLRQSNSLDFDDLLLKTVEVLGKNQERRDYYSSWFRYILVDEYQDTNRPQYEILRLLTSRHQNLFVVGDEDQSIYKFRGADIGNILNFERDFPGTLVIKLEQNYRSTQNILRVAGAVVENNTERKGKSLWTENHAGDVVTCHRAASSRSEALWVAGGIREILDESPDLRIAVLYRANFLSRNFEDVLLEAGIPYVLVGGVGFFNRMEVKDMLAYLRVVLNPEDDVALLRIINTPARGIGGSTVDTLTQAALEKGVPLMEVLRERVRDSEGAGRMQRPLARFVELVDHWSSRRDHLTIAGLLKEIVHDTGYQQKLEKQETAEEAENRMANIEELIQAAAESEERGETPFEFLDRAALASELDRFDPNARVVLMTLHSAKGLEFDVVYLAGLEDGLFPHIQSMNSKADLEEERRLCYVGITRARRKLFLTWTPFRRSFGADAGMPSLPSRFFHEMPPDLMEGFEGSDISYVDEDEEDYRSEHSDEESDIEERAEETRSFRIRRDFSRLQRPKRFASASAGRTPAHESTGDAQSKVLKAGMRVRHAQFGDGIILNRVRVGNEVKLTVTFSRVGKKTLIEKYAKLQTL